MKRKTLFAVRRSLIDGMGLFASIGIRKRQKIGEMSGELISVREARRRARKTQRIVIVELGYGTAIDGSHCESEFRFINHSCSPNLFMRVYGRRVEFYTLRKIRTAEELTCNYGASHHCGKLRCRCGSVTCRGYI